MQGRHFIRLIPFAFIALGLLAVWALDPTSLFGGSSPVTARDVMSPRALEEETVLAEAQIEVPAPIAGRVMPAYWASAPRLKPTAATAPVVAGLAAIVVDEASGDVLFDKNAHQQMQPASLTKIATLILALEYGRLDEEVVSDVNGFEMRGSSIMGLEVGDRFTLRDLLFGMMLPSGNDAALVIGRHIAGSDAAFVTSMNNLVERLGLQDTHFANPHGLGGGATHYTSAYDLAVLSRYGMSLPWFKEIVTTNAYTARGSRTIQVANINTFLYSFAGADGLKTGYTRGAGPTLAASATRNGHRLYAIVLNSGARDSDAVRLLSWAFANYDWPPS